MTPNLLLRQVGFVICVLVATLVPVPPATAGAVGGPASLSFSLDRRVVRAGAEVTGVVSAAPEARDRVVKIERLMPEGWVTVRRRTLPRGASRLSVPVPTGHYSAYSYRARAAVGQAAVTSAPTRLAVRPGYAPDGGANGWNTYYEGTAHRNVFMRWDSCANPIRYAVNDEQAWPGAIAETREAFRRISVATGLRFVRAGTTRLVPNGTRRQALPRGVDVVIAWVRQEQTPLLRSGVFGRAVPFHEGGYVNGAQRRTARITHAQVAIEKDSYLYLRPGFGKGPRRGALMMHELAHTLGLGHARGRKQVMFPGVFDIPSRFGAGDLTGLNQMGVQQGCLVRGR